VGTWDDSVNRWFVTQRTATLNSVSSVGSALGATLTIIGIAVVASIVLAIGRHWRQLGFLAAALTLEATVALTTSILVNRPRPNVPRLDAQDRQKVQKVYKAEDFDFRQVTTKDPTKNQAHELVKWQRTAAGISSLRLMLSQRLTALKLSQKNTTQKCHNCGFIEKWDAARAV
jgi:hypothetical protein